MYCSGRIDSSYNKANIDNFGKLNGTWLSFIYLQLKKYLIWFKISVLLVVWCVFTAFLMSNNEHVDQLSLISVPGNSSTRGG